MSTKNGIKFCTLFLFDFINNFHWYRYRILKCWYRDNTTPNPNQNMKNIDVCLDKWSVGDFCCKAVKTRCIRCLEKQPLVFKEMFFFSCICILELNRYISETRSCSDSPLCFLWGLTAVINEEVSLWFSNILASGVQLGRVICFGGVMQWNGRLVCVCLSLQRTPQRNLQVCLKSLRIMQHCSCIPLKNNIWCMLLKWSFAHPHVISNPYDARRGNEHAAISIQWKHRDQTSAHKRAKKYEMYM